MKRPLAVFGLAFFAATMLWVRLGGAPAPLPAVLLAAVFLLCAVLMRKMRGGFFAVLFGALFAALLLKTTFDFFAVSPVASLSGTQQTVTARVVETTPGYAEDSVNATLQVLQLDGEKPPRRFKVQVNSIYGVTVGDVIELPLAFSAYGGSSRQTRSYAKGFYVNAAARGDVAVTGQSHNFISLMRTLQYSASENIRARLPLRLSGVAAAMSVGDKRFLPAEAADAYRTAGLSHLLVVSGLHLSMLCGLLFWAVRSLAKSRRAAAGVCAVFIILFMAFTGFTPSIVRSGVLHLMVYCGLLLRRKADVLTSLGFAALVLVGTNPYAAADIGLLLSFTATLGALLGGQTAFKLRVRWQEKPAGIITSFLRWLAVPALTSLLVTAATLPVIIYSGMGVSLLSVPMNVIALPLLAPIVICGLLMAIPPALPVLGYLGLPASLICGALLAFLEKLTLWCQSLPFAFVPLGGAFGLVTVLLLYALVFLAVKTKRTAAYSAACALFLAAAFFLNSGLSRGTVKISIAGSGANASVVITGGGQSVVLYRGRQSFNAIERVLFDNRATECVLFVDMRQSGSGTDYEAFRPAQVVIAAEDIFAGNVYTPMNNVEISVVRQGGGLAACADVGGLKFVTTSGRVDLSPYAEADFLLPSGGEISGDFDTLLYNGTIPEWAEGHTAVYTEDGTTLWVRPGKSVVVR